MWKDAMPYCMAILLIINAVAFADEVKIIGNSSVPYDELSQEEVMKIFLNKLVEWPDKSKITLAIKKQGQVHERFVERYLKRSAEQYSRYWKMMLFAGKGIVPKIFERDEDIVRYISDTNGAIGYVSANVRTENVKTITVK